MKHLYSFLFIVLFALVSGCEDESKFSINPAIGFLTSESTISQTSEDGVDVKFYSNVAITEPITVEVQVNGGGVAEYDVDFVTLPEPVNGIITVTIDPEDEDGAFFSVFPIETGAEVTQRVNFQIISVSGGGLSMAQNAALNYNLNISGFEEVIPVNISHNFNDCTVDFATPSGFIEVFENAKIDRGWGCRAFGRNSSRAPRASAFGGAAGEDRAWMIRQQPFAAGVGADVTIDFYTYSQFAGPGKVSVKWSSNYSGSGNPLAATWTTLTTLDNQFPAAGTSVTPPTWTNVKGTFTDISGANVYIAFVWTGGTAAASASYDIDDLSIIVE